jgi:hypothetical protein
VQFRRLLIGLVGVLLTVASAAAEARDHHGRTERLIRAITLKREGGGSLISVTFVGHKHARVLRTPEPLNTVTLADIDRDGRLDIVASSGAQGPLRFWRNEGRGHFVAVLIPSRTIKLVRGPGIRQPRRIIDQGPAASDDGSDVAMPRVPVFGAAATSSPLFRAASTLPAAVQRTIRSGRAPPASSVSRSA